MNKYRIVEHKGYTYLGSDPSYSVDAYYPDPDSVWPQAIPTSGWLTLDYYSTLEEAEEEVDKIVKEVLRKRNAPVSSCKVVREYEV